MSNPLLCPGKLLGFAVLFCALSLSAQNPDGTTLYQQQCFKCHSDPAEKRAPTPAAMRMMSAEKILRSLESGVMLPQGLLLTPAERRTLAEYLSGKPLGQTAPKPKHKKRPAARPKESP
ncbi:MAG TPA: cytochrome c [Candidatus Angelobacter sp.]|nr:cytochrome c [Candidatus Angelobacter sp.]